MSLQIGHRKSYDLDFVTTEAITESLIDTFLSTLSPKNLLQRLLSDTQYAAVIDGIKVTIFQDKASFLYETISFNESKIASIKDIFSTKLFVLGKRNAWRDYVDIASCIKYKEVILKEGIRDAVERYKITQKWILEPLVYFDDVDIVPVQWAGKEMSVEEIKNILTTSVAEFINDRSHAFL